MKSPQNLNSNAVAQLNQTFLHDIRTIITTAQANAVRSVEFHRVEMYWKLGERIFVEEQHEKERAEYGAYLIQNLSIEMEKEFGSGFSKRQLERARQFYRLFPIASALRSQLNWYQYRLLISISDSSKREFYELESALISHLQEFLLELGNGYTFVARQKRLLIEDDEFFADLVFYNRLLRCFVVIELKTEKMSHRDLGQLQMYVNYYDRYEKRPDENPTIGILLCPARNKGVVEMTLPKDTAVYASEYQLSLPDARLLEQKIEEWLLEFERNENIMLPDSETKK